MRDYKTFCMCSGCTHKQKKMRVALRGSFQVTIKDKYYLQISLASFEKGTL